MYTINLILFYFFPNINISYFLTNNLIKLLTIKRGVLFNEKKAVGLEVHVTLDLEVNKLTVKDKDNET